ncbi:MAG: hypothetical protein A3E37_03790 [Candidatus Andersenbacteria bacterium RIFCSPHIGHO2_12_FULL_46_9]|nr:MAG: hypothetical protein UW94_C0005G0137 [Parcubacteria group bacterium GW2011_GWA2_45_14]OGY33253.1 MAG: hypothetical protein A3B76_01000 [Candidatus Andersenbacteria bacterium RIFCSPHIGHO2_02_FULL_46_16]OGY38357.1 MAG: hypothetical protein A3E37_03790 [Candidatus Andersenbacteria bacterium RIFCSPHIGHO2_12_FULL_46_9]OGY38426.1 MAG: hypothetical protein A3I08_02645 [Candidatus Andersenbacteria bacterium RIFCSPLOWO2_02_FULL_46_11]OGY41960.1 MAG: hypothetical protein A3G57_04595 [Candidatus A
MKIMVWTILLKPTRWKVVFSLVPFVFPILRMFLGIAGVYDYIPVDLIIYVDEPIMFIGYIDIFISQPFAPILRALGWWSSNSIFVGPDGPLLLGSFVVAITYSMLIYIVWSLVSGWKNKQASFSKK